MKSTLILTLSIFTLSAALLAAPLAAAQSGSAIPVTVSTTGPVVFDTVNLVVNPDLGRYSGFLNTSTSWQLIQIPVSGVNLATVKSVSLSVSGLPEGLTIELARATQAGNFLLLYVNVNRSSGNAVPSGLADVTVLSGATTVARFQVAVEDVPALNE